MQLSSDDRAILAEVCGKPEPPGCKATPEPYRPAVVDRAVLDFAFGPAVVQGMIDRGLLALWKVAQATITVRVRRPDGTESRVVKQWKQRHRITLTPLAEGLMTVELFDDDTGPPRWRWRRVYAENETPPKEPILMVPEWKAVSNPYPEMVPDDTVREWYRDELPPPPIKLDKPPGRRERRAAKREAKRRAG